MSYHGYSGVCVCVNVLMKRIRRRIFFDKSLRSKQPPAAISLTLPGCERGRERERARARETEREKENKRERERERERERNREREREREREKVRDARTSFLPSTT